MAQIHQYPSKVTWSGGREGSGEVQSPLTGVNYPLSVPPEFGGTGAGTNPEELLTNAITGCYSITFGIVATAQRLSYTRVETESVGEVEQPNAATFTFKKITIRPTIVLPAEAEDAQVELAEKLAHKADLYCIVTNAVRGKVEIIIEPKIVRE